MNRTEDEAIEIILRTFQRFLKNIENDEVLYKDEKAMKSFLADMVAEASSLKSTMEALRQDVRIAQESERKAKAIAERKADELENLWQKHEKLLIVNREYRRDYTSKPVREIIKTVPMRIDPRDAHDMPQRWQHVENHLFRLCHDKNYNPDAKYRNQFGSKLKTTTHLDINI